MSEQQENNERSAVHFEGGLPVIEVQSEAELKRAAAEARRQQYEDDQITLNRRLVNATLALVAATIALAIASGVQIWYIHRQWKLTSDSLSKMGDQIWAAKDAAFAAKQAANTGSETLKQMQAQTKAQQDAVSISRSSLVDVQRASVSFIGQLGVTPIIEDGKITEIKITAPWQNGGTTTTRKAFSRINYKWSMGPEGLPDNFTFPDLGNVMDKQFSIAPKGYGNATMTVPINVFELVKQKRARLFIWGWLSYHDEFKGTPTRLAEFCDEVINVKSSNEDMTNPASQIGWEVELCPKHNCSDEECTDYEERTQGR